MDLPAYVQTLNEEHQSIWQFAFDAANRKTKDALKSIDYANGVMFKALGPDKFAGETTLLGDLLDEKHKEYQYVSSWEVEERALTQVEADYSPTGGVADEGAKACANCRFFISPARCAVVSGEIAPTGLSKMWAARPARTSEPIPVIIVDGTKEASTTSAAETSEATPTPPVTTPVTSITAEVAAGAYRPIGTFTKIARAFTSLVGVKPEPVTDGFIVTKQADGRLRWFARYSNAWEDRDGEIITDAAHKEYVEWVNSPDGVMPELWLWHTKGTRFGEADWIDYSDGFAHASGLIDAGCEGLVEALSEKDLGVSHGFLSAQDGPFVTKYRTFEISPLLRERAAVWTTDFSIVNKEHELMAFTKERRQFLVETLGEDRVKQLESSTEGAVKQLKDLGIAFKESQPDAPTTDENVGIKAFGEQIANLTALVEGVVGGFVTLRKDMDDLKKPVEQKVDEATEDAFFAKMSKALKELNAAKPTGSDGNVLTEQQVKERGGPTGDQGDFLAGVIGKSLLGIAPGTENGGAGTPAAAAVRIQ